MFAKKQTMRKLKLQVQMTIDGFIAGPNGEMDWVVWNWDDELKNYVTALTEPVETIVLGRNLAEGFIPHWSSVAADVDNEAQAAGRKFTETEKVVFTKTIKETKWSNTALANGDLEEEINTLKSRDRGDIMAYGGATFVSSLIKKGLIDELHLFINPVAIGKGMPIFQQLEEKQNFTLIKASSFSCGIVVLHYETVRS
jgi:dihydrofolate reductase